MKVRDVILIEHDGYPGSNPRHRQYKHQAKSGLVTIVGKANDDLAPVTLNSILKQAGSKP